MILYEVHGMPNRGNPRYFTNTQYQLHIWVLIVALFFAIRYGALSSSTA